MIITATEFKRNIGKYLAYAGNEDVIVTKNGTAVARLTGASEDRVALAKSLFGIVPAKASLEEAREERLSRHEHSD